LQSFVIKFPKTLLLNSLLPAYPANAILSTENIK